MPAARQPHANEASARLGISNKRYKKTRILSECEADADDGGVASGEVAFEAVAFVAKEKFSGAATDPGFDEPIGCFVSD